MITLRMSSVCVVTLYALLSGCGDGGGNGDERETEAMARAVVRDKVFPAPTKAPVDAFTYANYGEVRVTHVDFDLDLDFENKVVDGIVVLDLEYLDAGAERLVLDANDLIIKSVEARSEGDWLKTSYELGPDEPVLGSRLEIALPENVGQVRIAYRTDPASEGLQWLSPEQTAGKTRPFLFSQFQALNARTVAPLQDTPAVRFTYTASVSTPPGLNAVMSAVQDQDAARDGEFFFEMPQPIPSYLVAIAVGDFDFAAIDDHIGVYAEDYIIEEAAAEFEDTPLMEQAIQRLYGPYRWGRYDLMVLPPSFPYGGMENPRISFLTPTLIAGDKSLTNVVAHELAHSWSGNLVTNATWRDAWLNEGFTSYVENRVMEELYGEERAAMERALDLHDLKRDIEEADRPELTALKMPEDLEHPEEAFSNVIYGGGMFFLKFLEERFGREAFDAFLRGYFDEFAFQSLTTEEFLSYFEDHLWAQNPNAVAKDEITAWIYEPGLPDTLPVPRSDALEKVMAQQAQWLDGAISASDIMTKDWTTHEWLRFVNELPDAMATEKFAALDAAFGLSLASNAEIASAWYLKSIAGGYEPAMAPAENFLMRVGRGKFIYRLYEALIDHDRRAFAAAVYERARPGYHPIAQRRIDEIFAGED